MIKNVAPAASVAWWTWNWLGTVSVFFLVLSVILWLWGRRGTERKGSPAGHVTCTRCGERVPEWFIETFPTGERICRHDTESWPYPKPGHTEDEYVEYLKEWRGR